MAQQYYIKATGKGGISQANYEPTITYKVGIIIHPNPDKESTAACGTGIHLAKTLKAAKENVPDAKEFFYALPGVILGEDDKKLRCVSCQIVKRLTTKELKQLEQDEMTREEKLRRETELRERLGGIYETGGLVGKDWLMTHLDDYSVADIAALGIEIFVDAKRRCELKSVLSKSKTRAALKAVMA